MSLRKLSDQELLLATNSAVDHEREAITTVIRHFQEIYDRRLFLPKYTSMFEMLRDEYSYCAGSAQIRLNTMRLIREIPAVEAKIESGEMSLSVAANVQSFLRLEKKNSRPYSENAKIELVEACTGKSVHEVEREFARRNPEIEKRDSVRFTSDDRIRVNHSLSVKVEDKIQRIKEIWSHVDPNMSREQILDRMTEIVLNQIDPLRKAQRSEQKKAKRSKNSKIELKNEMTDRARTMATHNIETPFHVGEADSAKNVDAKFSLHPHEMNRTRSRYIAAGASNAVHLKNDGQGCAYVNPVTSKLCGSHFQLQRDHIVPYAQGGANRPENLRLLCAQHNRWRSQSRSHVRAIQLAYG